MLDTAIAAVTQAGQLVKQAFYGKAAVDSSFKSEGDTLQVVTDTDVAAEKIILDILRKEFPDHSIFSEEAGDTAASSDYRWIVDPIDGTSNYARRLPFFCVTVCLTYKNEPILGVVYQPVTGELFAAEKGKGATLNGTPLRCGGATGMGKTFVTIDRGKSKEEKDRLAVIFGKLNQHVRSLRMPGSSALQACYVACGKFDAAAFNGISFYDVAAAALIAREAGLALSDYSGNPWQLKTGDLLICHPELQKAFVGILQ